MREQCDLLLKRAVPLALQDALAILRRRALPIAVIALVGGVAAILLKADPRVPKVIEFLGPAILWWFLLADTIRRADPDYKMTVSAIIQIVGYALGIVILFLIPAVPVLLISSSGIEHREIYSALIMLLSAVFISARFTFMYFLAAMSSDRNAMGTSWSISGVFLGATLILATLEMCADWSSSVLSELMPIGLSVSAAMLSKILLNVIALPVWFRWMGVCGEKFYGSSPLSTAEAAT